MSELVLERRGQEGKTVRAGSISLTPPIDEDYWAYRVKVSDKQAIVAFPKFMTIGIGFAVEKDWNTNLPWTCTAEEIFSHINHNKGSKRISDGDCIEAIRLIQAAIREDGAASSTWRTD
jgi:hypothetical protein